MENNTNKFTFSQFFDITKIALKKGLIYILVSVIVVGAILLGIRAFTASTSSISKITIPETTTQTLTILNDGKSSATTTALTSFKEGEYLDSADKVLENLYINSEIPDENKDDADFIPTTFEITLYNTNELDLSLNEYNKLLDLITAELLNNSAFSAITEKTSSPANTAYDNLISTTAIIIVLVSTLFVAYVVAYVQTFSRLRKNGYFDTPETSTQSEISSQAEISVDNENSPIEKDNDEVVDKK